MCAKTASRAGESNARAPRIAVLADLRDLISGSWRFLAAISGIPHEVATRFPRTRGRFCTQLENAPCERGVQNDTPDGGGRHERECTQRRIRRGEAPAEREHARRHARREASPDRKRNAHRPACDWACQAVRGMELRASDGCGMGLRTSNGNGTTSKTQPKASRHCGRTAG